MSLFRVQPRPPAIVKVEKTETDDDDDPRPKFTFGRSVLADSPTPPPPPKTDKPSKDRKGAAKEVKDSRDTRDTRDTKAQTKFVDLPGCSEQIMACEGWISCISLFRELGNHSSQIYLRRRLEKAAAKQGFERKTMTHDWDANAKTWFALAPPKNPDDYLDWAVPCQNVGQFATWALERSRKTKDEKLRLLSKFGVQLNEQESEKLKGPVENELLGVLSQCLPFKIEYQYRVGKYRLDAFIPRLHLAIQIDEHGHRGYDPAEEKEYDEVIRDHNIVCIRFNPDQKYAVPAQYELIRLVWERTLSPDFSSFREKLKLV